MPILLQVVAVSENFLHCQFNFGGHAKNKSIVYSVFLIPWNETKGVAEF